MFEEKRLADREKIYQKVFGKTTRLDVSDEERGTYDQLPVVADQKHFAIVPDFFNDADWAFKAANELGIFEVYMLRKAWTNLDGEWMVCYRSYGTLVDFSVGDTPAEAVAEACLRVINKEEEEWQEKAREEAL